MSPVLTSPSPKETEAHHVSESLGLWEPKRSLTLEAARRHSRLIRRIRYGLIAAAIILIGILIWQFATQQTSFIVDDNPGEAVKMINPRYSGRTKDGLPYKLTSNSAIRLTQNDEAVELEYPVLNFIRTRNVEASLITADKGTYDDLHQILNLVDSVDLKTDDGYHCRSTHARIYARDKRIEGDKPIACQGNFGHVEGETFEIKDDYSVFVFDGGMTGRLEPDNAQDASDASESGDHQSAGFGFEGDQPIFITAQKATYKGGLTILTGDVDVRQGQTRILSDEMYLYREEATETAQGSIRLGAVSKIDARGNFHYMSPENDVRGKRGVYLRPSGVITVTGNVLARQPKGNIAKTERLTYNVRTKTIRFEGNCIGKGCKSRSTIRFNTQN